MLRFVISFCSCTKQDNFSFAKGFRIFARKTDFNMERDQRETRITS